MTLLNKRRNPYKRKCNCTKDDARASRYCPLRNSVFHGQARKQNIEKTSSYRGKEWLRLSKAMRMERPVASNILNLAGKNENHAVRALANRMFQMKNNGKWTSAKFVSQALDVPYDEAVRWRDELKGHYRAATPETMEHVCFPSQAECRINHSKE